LHPKHLQYFPRTLNRQEFLFACFSRDMTILSDENCFVLYVIYRQLEQISLFRIRPHKNNQRFVCFRRYRLGGGVKNEPLPVQKNPHLGNGPLKINNKCFTKRRFFIPPFFCCFLYKKIKQKIDSHTSTNNVSYSRF
jgi:hypothetical protein